MTDLDESLLEVLEMFEGTRIAIIGDVMLDVWLEGPTRRISPEAPVPVIELTTRESRLGGAANVASVVAGLGGSMNVLGVTGDDEGADRLEEGLRAAGASFRLCRDVNRPTTRKTRIVSGPQQVCRVDEESVAPMDDGVTRCIHDALEVTLDGADAVVLSDYGKGLVDDVLVAEVVRRASARGLPVIADPWGDGARRFHAATLVKPNRHEACVALGLSSGEAVSVGDLAVALWARMSGSAVLVTDGPGGMALVVDGEPVVIPAIRREVTDVTGAGDSVAAVLALSLACGADLEVAARLGNAAGGVAVTKRGTTPFDRSELAAALDLMAI